MNTTSNRRKPLKNNTKTKASGSKGVQKAEGVKNAIKNNLNKVMKKSRKISNKPKNNNRNTTTGTSKGGDNALRNVSGSKTSNKIISSKGHRSNNEREELKQHKKKYRKAVLHRSEDIVPTVLTSIGCRLTEDKFEYAWGEVNVPEQDDSNPNK